MRKSQCAANRRNSGFSKSFPPTARWSSRITPFIWSNNSSAGTPPKYAKASSKPAISVRIVLRGKKRSQSKREYPSTTSSAYRFPHGKWKSAKSTWA